MVVGGCVSGGGLALVLVLSGGPWEAIVTSGTGGVTGLLCGEGAVCLWAGLVL